MTNDQIVTLIMAFMALLLTIGVAVLLYGYV